MGVGCDVRGLVSTEASKITPRLHQTKLNFSHLTFECVRVTGPVYLKQVICPVPDLSRRSLRSAGCSDMFVSRENTSIGWRSFPIAAAVVWNALPHDLRSPHISRQQFRSKLKTHLFRQAYNTAWLLCEQFCWGVKLCNCNYNYFVISSDEATCMFATLLAAQDSQFKGIVARRMYVMQILVYLLHVFLNLFYKLHYRWLSNACYFHNYWSIINLSDIYNLTFDANTTSK